MKNPIHLWFPHEEVAVAGACILSALAFGTIAVILGLRTHRRVNIWHAVAQVGNGSMFPIFVILPFVPWDSDLDKALDAEPLAVMLAGVFGMLAAIYILFFTHTKAVNPYGPKRSPKPPAAKAPPKNGRRKKPPPRRTTAA